MSEKSLKPEEQMMQWITSKWITKPIQVVAELGIADLLVEKPLGVEDLAQKTETHAPTLYRVLRALTAVDIFVETGERVFALTPLAQCLCSGAMRPLARMFLSDWHDTAWDGLMESVHSGVSGFEHAFGQNAFDWLEKNSNARAVFDQGQGAKALGFAKAVMQSYDFSKFKTLCDVGGGQGVFLREILVAYPHLKGIVADLPGTLPAAQKVIAAAGLQDRCTAIGCDMFNEAPPLSGGYLLVNVLHDWDDQKCRLILENLKRGMARHSRFLIVEFLLNQGPDICVAKLMDLEVLVMGGGRERTLAEYKSLLSSVGIKVADSTYTSSGLALLECFAKG